MISVRSEVQVFPGPPLSQARLNGAIAQLGERLLCKQEVVGSIPSGSTKLCGARDGSIAMRSSRFPNARPCICSCVALISIARCRLSDIVKRRSFRSVCTVMSCVRRHPMARLTARLSRIDLEASWSFCQCPTLMSFLSQEGVFVRSPAEVNGH